MGGDGDRGNMFPASDADDFGKGARFIPSEVTLARRRGEKVMFVQECNNQCCWYWLMEDGIRIYHWNRADFEAIARHNGKKEGEGAGSLPQLWKSTHQRRNRQALASRFAVDTQPPRRLSHYVTKSNRGKI
jgi:hypothetical protein